MDGLKWALVDLLKLLNEMHGGQFHTELQKIAAQLGVAIQPVGLREVTLDTPVTPVNIKQRATRG